jgi:hypothetical protein
MISFAVMTVERRNAYVHRLLSGLSSGSSVRLISGSPKIDYLTQYRTSPSFEIFAPSPQEWSEFERTPVEHRAVWNYWRSLRLGPKRNTRGLLVFEDDVIVATGWERRLFDTVEQLKRKVGERFVLSLYIAWRRLTPDRGCFYATYPVTTFFGTQAIYYPESIRASFAAYIEETGLKVFRSPYDMLLKEYIRMMGIPLYVTVPCLVQHVGVVGTGLGQFHLARQFQMNLEPNPCRSHKSRMSNR